MIYMAGCVDVWFLSLAGCNPPFALQLNYRIPTKAPKFFSCFAQGLHVGHLNLSLIGVLLSLISQVLFHISLGRLNFGINQEIGKILAWDFTTQYLEPIQGLSLTRASHWNNKVFGFAGLIFFDKLQNLVGQHSDVLESLSPIVRKRVEVLREIQAEVCCNHQLPVISP
ncbi:hypothetical protein L1887_02507 [Cichorium endivia]|nr:hypothetical protein L1887_02507 [Cichorium endivia]